MNEDEMRAMFNALAKEIFDEADRNGIDPTPVMLSMTLINTRLMDIGTLMHSCIEDMKELKLPPGLIQQMVEAFNVVTIQNMAMGDILSWWVSRMAGDAEPPKWQN